MLRRDTRLIGEVHHRRLSLSRHPLSRAKSNGEVMQPMDSVWSKVGVFRGDGAGEDCDAAGSTAISRPPLTSREVTGATRGALFINTSAPGNSGARNTPSLMGPFSGNDACFDAQEANRFKPYPRYDGYRIKNILLRG